MMQVIGLSGKARHGKDTVAELLTDWMGMRGLVAKRIGFADAVKEEARSIGWNGIKDDAGRTLLQKIGADRRKEDPLYWVKTTFKTMASWENDPNCPDFWIITDVRYKNEADFVKSQGGLVWRIMRLNEDYSPFQSELTAEQKLHASEIDLDGYQGFDAMIVNRTMFLLSGTVSELCDIVYKRWKK